MNRLRSRKLIGVLSLVAMASLNPVSGLAQTTATDDTKKEEAQTLDKIVVTGSYIPAAADEAKALPVQVIDQIAIADSGVNTSVLDVLRKTVPQLQGANNIGIENANIAGGATNGGSQASLRNIDTLVLINGKRVAPSAVAAGGESGTGGEFVDLNLVPLSAVERIEVLKDGASAVYGTDAVSGVINIILKKDFQGAQIDTHFSMAPKDTGGYLRERSVAITGGASDGKTHIMFSAEWTRQQPLWERDTAYDNPYYATPSYPGVINDGSGNYYRLKPGLNSPGNTTPTTVANLVAQGIYVPTSDVASGFNLSQKPTVQNAVDKRIATLAASHAVTDQITLKGDFLYAFTETRYELNPQPVSASSTTLLSYAPTYVAPITDPGYTIRNRFIYGPNRIYDNRTNFYRTTIELEGKVNEYFNWDVYANYNITYQTAFGENQILNSALLNALKTGLIDLFAIQQDPVKLAKANIFGTSVADYTSQLYTFNAVVNGKIFDLPAGSVQYAAGAEYRKETLKATADYNSIIPVGATTSLWNNGTSLSPFDNKRDVKSEFAELKVPLLSDKQAIPGLYTLSLDGAVRHEAYSDGNSTTVPKISLRYLPINDEYAIRATFAKSFTAPTLYDLYGPSSSGFTTSPGGLNRYDTSGNAIMVSDGHGGTTNAKFPNLQGQQINGFNPLLKPSTAKSVTVGAVISPKWLKGFELEVDYFNIKQSDLIGSPGGTLTMMQSVERYGAASPFTQYVTLGNYAFSGGTHVTTPGQLSLNPSNVYVIQNLVNIASQKQHGFDVSAKYTLPWKEYGRFTVHTEWSILQSFFLQSGPTDPGTEYSGYDDYGTMPKVRSYSTVDWDYKGYGATFGLTHLNSVDNLSGDHISAYTTADLQFRVDLQRIYSPLHGVSFDIGINNLTNRMPPLDRTNYSSPPFDGSAYSFFGRVYYADLHIKF